jgi:hypothetical protein
MIPMRMANHTAEADVIRRALIIVAMLAILVIASSLTSAQSVLTMLDQQQLDEAIHLGGDEKASARILDAYVLQPKAGWGDGPLIGALSTPYSRVLRAAAAARRRKAPFGASDVTPDLLAQELHVIAIAQRGWPEDSMTAVVQSVALTVRVDTGSEQLIQPMRTAELSAEARVLYGITSSGPGVLVVFPLTALTRSTVVRVTFDRTARGSGLSTCRECVVPVDLRRIR